MINIKDQQQEYIRITKGNFKFHFYYYLIQKIIKILISNLNNIQETINNKLLVLKQFLVIQKHLNLLMILKIKILKQNKICLI